MIEDELYNFYYKKRVLITGHTGFKGSWLSIWLNKLGAEVSGYAMAPETEPSNYCISGVDKIINSILGDLNDSCLLKQTVDNIKPEIVFHLAAQSIVRESYANPVTTFRTNIMGLINLLEIVRMSDTVRAVLITTSDKCYSNREWLWGYKETDELGGVDPYSTSKACAELIVSSYRKSFLNVKSISVATARAGNVIGGGDWSEDRLIPDCIRGISSGREIIVRNPDSIRPWQHVLDALSGYLLLMYKLYCHGGNYASSWNFGPKQFDVLNVLEVVKYITSNWRGSYSITHFNENMHESGFLQLDCSKAFHELKWIPTLSITEAMELTISWYRKFYEEGADPYKLCSEQIESYMDKRIRKQHKLYEY